MKRTYLKRGIWYLGGRKNEIGDLPVLGTLARSLLVSAASAVGGEVLKGLGKKLGGGGWWQKTIQKKTVKKASICLGITCC